MADKRNDKTLSDGQLNALLACYAVTIDVTEAAVGAVVGGARRRAVQLRNGVEPGFWAMAAQVLGFRRPSAAAWSGAAGLAMALMIGLTVGSSDLLSSLDEHGYTIDFDSVLGTNTMAASEDLSL